MRIIKKIEIKHFRSIFEQNIEELSHLSVFGGQNDSGKSNVLRALNLFFNNQTSFLEEFDFQSDFSVYSRIKVRESKRGRQYISIKIFFDETQIKGKTELKKLASANGGLWIERRWWAYSEDGSYDQSIPSYINNASQGIKRSFSIFLESIKFVYIPAFKSANVFSYILQLSAKNKGLFLSTDAKHELDSNISKTTQEFSKDFSDIAGIETSVTLPISLESFWSSLEVTSQFEGMYHTPKKHGDPKDYQIKFTSRGEGIKSLFVPVVLGWLSRKARNDYWIWGIDEPENALEALRADNLFKKFIEYSKYAQIFVSTHSPSFLFPQEGGEGNDINDNCRIFMTEQKNRGATEFSLLDGQLERFEGLFGYDYGSFLRIQKGYSQSIKKQELLKNEVETLQALRKPILFVEGTTDKTILENAWQKLFPGTPLPFSISGKGNAKQVKFVLENSTIFPQTAVFGLFDFDQEGHQAWNGLNHPEYSLDHKSKPETCLIKKRNKERHFALLLPVPTNPEVHNLVINPNTDEHFGDRSKFFMELMFYGVAKLKKYFEKAPAPGGGYEIRFVGSKNKFSRDTSKLTANDFQSFKALFETIQRLSR